MYYNSQSIYDAAGGGRYTNVKTAFDVGYEAATGGKGSDNPTRSVKNFYEQRLSNYLKKLPADVDLAAIPNKYRGNISNFLSQQKQEYVNAANSVDEYEVGSQDYMDRVAKMNQIKSSFENLDKQMKLYGENKKDLIGDIEGQTISMYGSNQANVNLLRSVYNEELDMMIDETGNVKFVGVDGELSLNDMPDYSIKDYETASAMTKMGVGVYQNALKTGQVLSQNNPLYFQYQNQLKTAIDQGGDATLMSILHDGLVGNVVLADGMKDQIQAYKDGNLSFSELRDQVVNNYMGVLVKQSQTGVSQRKVNPSKSNINKSGGKISATDRKAFFEVDQMLQNFNSENVETLINLLPANIALQKNSDGTYNILTGGGSTQVDTEDVIDFNNLKTFDKLMKYANIHPMYWPEHENSTQSNTQSSTSGGAADNF